MLDDDMEQMMGILALKELEDRKTKKRRRSKVGQLCILHNRMLSHNMLMRRLLAACARAFFITTASLNKSGVVGLPVMQRCCDILLLLAGRGGEEEKRGGVV
jgi:hypothetical protein